MTVHPEPRPPRAAEWLLRRASPPEDAEWIVRDMRDELRAHGRDTGGAGVEGSAGERTVEWIAARRIP